VVVDAAKLGSVAHRVRAFWIYAVPSRILKQRYGQFDREWVHDRKETQGIPRKGRKVNLAPADDPDISSYYRMNYAGELFRFSPRWCRRRSPSPSGDKRAGPIHGGRGQT
jgi:hypothetical protein